MHYGIKPWFRYFDNFVRATYVDQKDFLARFACCNARRSVSSDYEMSETTKWLLEAVNDYILLALSTSK
jgi:hypothetical protein